MSPQVQMNLDAFGSPTYIFPNVANTQAEPMPQRPGITIAEHLAEFDTWRDIKGNSFDEFIYMNLHLEAPPPGWTSKICTFNETTATEIAKCIDDETLALAKKEVKFTQMKRRSIARPSMAKYAVADNIENSSPRRRQLTAVPDEETETVAPPAAKLTKVSAAANKVKATPAGEPVVNKKFARAVGAKLAGSKSKSEPHEQTKLTAKKIAVRKANKKD